MKNIIQKALTKKPAIILLVLFVFVAFFYQNCGPAQFGRKVAKVGEELGPGPTRSLDVIVRNGAGIEIPSGGSTCAGGATQGQAETIGIYFSYPDPVSYFSCKRDTPITDSQFYNCNEARELHPGGRMGVYLSLPEFGGRRGALEYDSLAQGVYSLLIRGELLRDGFIRSTNVVPVTFRVEDCDQYVPTTTTTTRTTTSSSSSTTTSTSRSTTSSSVTTTSTSRTTTSSGMTTTSTSRTTTTTSRTTTTSSRTTTTTSRTTTTSSRTTTTTSRTTTTSSSTTTTTSTSRTTTTTSRTTTSTSRTTTTTSSTSSTSTSRTTTSTSRTTTSTSRTTTTSSSTTTSTSSSSSSTTSTSTSTSRTSTTMACNEPNSYVYPIAVVDPNTGAATRNTSAPRSCVNETDSCVSDAARINAYCYRWNGAIHACTGSNAPVCVTTTTSSSTSSSSSSTTTTSSTTSTSQPPQAGVCGTAREYATATIPPTSGRTLCASGTPSTVGYVPQGALLQGEPYWVWSCDVSGATPTYCGAPRIMSASCRTVSNHPGKPSNFIGNYCNYADSVGTRYIQVEDIPDPFCNPLMLPGVECTGTLRWNCPGFNGGSPANNCSGTYIYRLPGT